MSTSTFYRQFAETSIAVFWDIEDCKIPDGLGASDVSANIRKALKDSGYFGTVSIMAYGDTEDMKHDLISAGITPIQVPKAGERFARLLKIVNGMWGWVLDHRYDRSNMMYIMGDMSQDREFIRTLYLLIRKKFNILLCQPQSASGHLLQAAHRVWLWASLAVGGAPIPESELAERSQVNYWDAEPDCESDESDRGQYD